MKLQVPLVDTVNTAHENLQGLEQRPAVADGNQEEDPPHQNGGQKGIPIPALKDFPHLNAGIRDRLLIQENNLVAKSILAGELDRHPRIEEITAGLRFQLHEEGPGLGADREPLQIVNIIQGFLAELISADQLFLVLSGQVVKKRNFIL